MRWHAQAETGNACHGATASQVNRRYGSV